MTVAAPSRQSLRFRGRSFLALVLAPEPPLAAWIEEIDALGKRSPGFFRGRPVVLDVSALPLDKAGLAQLVADLFEREIRIMGIEGAKPSMIGLGMPPLISGGRHADDVEVPDAAPKGTPAAAATPIVAPRQAPVPSLMLDAPVRSGQSVIFPQGDVTIVGSVASGAEIVAGGSIHVYGPLRGRAIAGSTGNAEARIFCHKLEAELVAIDGLYKTAEDMESDYRGRSVQIWLDGDTIMMTALS
ncbi:septum site-determining protein MinC [Propylenella binzhouense]|uniref:Probable septum site-determining protein MinC n=1 Tax=Propylenella binzhouense TaxID=2555902 RepID=A0A964WT40_9HYPH|nr:septum formation inhibitor MinC [Propylenella binzhouense]